MMKPVLLHNSLVALALLLTSSFAVAETIGSEILSSTEVYDKLPHQWVFVTEKEGKQVIQTFCDAGVETLTMIKKDGRIELWHFTGQESTPYKVLKVRERNNHLTLQLEEHYSTSSARESAFFTFLDEDKTLARVAIRGKENIFARGKESDEFKVDYTETILGLPVLPPSEECEF